MGSRAISLYGKHPAAGMHRSGGSIDTALKDVFPAHPDSGAHARSRRPHVRGPLCLSLFSDISSKQGDSRPSFQRPGVPLLSAFRHESSCIPVALLHIKARFKGSTEAVNPGFERAGKPVKSGVHANAVLIYHKNMRNHNFFYISDKKLHSHFEHNQI